MSGFRASAAFTADWQHFDYSEEDGVATVTFSRPDVLNALTFDVYADLRDLLRQLPHRDVDVLIIAGRGRGFCSGGDVEEIIGELAKFDSRHLLDFTRMTGEDFRIAVEKARFHFLFTKVGLSGGDMGSAYLLPRMVGVGRATEILMFGDPVDAARALEIGLVNQVVTADELEAATAALAARIVSGPTFAYAATKTLITREQDMDLGGAIEMEAMTQALLMTTSDHAEFLASFREKRDPDWTGR
jgi:enoyl-CoA hydratase/carnithine racemase